MLGIIISVLRQVFLRRATRGRDDKRFESQARDKVRLPMPCTKVEVEGDVAGRDVREMPWRRAPFGIVAQRHYLATGSTRSLCELNGKNVRFF